MVIQPWHLSLRQVQNLQYHIYTCYFVHVLYLNLLHMLTKGVKYVSPSAKGFSRYLCWNYIASKRVSCVRATHKEYNIFIWCCFLWNFSSKLVYTSQQYTEVMAMRPAVSYTPYATYSREKTGDIITFTQFEEGNLLSETKNLWSETRDDTESSNESDDDSTMPPLMSEE